ncbi:Uncharacterised protein [Hafnia alvei]|nr:Uncharacterised protein [Hafnia alvei]
MFNKNELTTKEMTLKERVKFIFYAYLPFLCLPEH